MKTQFALDLRMARKKAGYTQGDVAHLLDCHQSLVSELEHGKQRPRLEQIVDLSLIYGRSFESLFAEVMAERRAHLANQLKDLPEPEQATAQTFNRDGSLARLREHLSEPPDHDSA